MEGDSATSKDSHLISKMHKTIKTVTEFLEEMKMSLAIGQLMEFTNDLVSYSEEKLNRYVYFECVRNLAVLIAPFAPHVAEEMWERLGEKGFISVHKWPVYDESRIDEEAEVAEEMSKELIRDIRKVLQLIKVERPKEIMLIVSSVWKYKFFEFFKKEKTKDMRTIMNVVLKEENLRQHGKDIAKLVPALLKDPSKMPVKVLDQDKEYQSITEVVGKIKREFDCKVKVERAEDSHEKKALSAMPGKPALIIK